MRETMPWERQYGESHQAFEAFHEYCLLGNSRSIRTLSQRLNKSVPLLGKWSSKWKWQDRVRAYDNMLIRQEMETAKQEIAEMRKRQIEIGKFFQSKGIDAIREKVKNEDKLVAEELRDLMNLVVKGMQMETEARLNGLDMIGNKEDGERNDGISDERRREIDDFFSK